jgi:hypothetical protein
MADPASPVSPRKHYRATQGLRPGDHVVSADRWEVMVVPPGLYVTKTQWDGDKRSPTAANTLVWWDDKPNPEAFNPYDGWHTDNGCNGCDEPAEPGQAWCAECHPLEPAQGEHNG